MKKFVLFLCFVVSYGVLFAQITCPSNVKRNNGNDCKTLPAGTVATGGGIEIEWPVAPDSRLQIALIISSQGTATVVESTKVIDNRAGKTFISWCFETDNIGPVSQGALQYQFYLDKNGNNQQDITSDPITNENSFLCSNATLPLTLTSFDVVQKNNRVVLTWSTILELNNDGFDIERKTGNGQYKKIAFVDSKAPGGNGSAYSYNFEDVDALPNGPVYYRIRQFDFDGTTVYSEIRAIKIGNGTYSLLFYPNPSRGTTNIAIPDGAGNFDLFADDITGKNIRHFSNLKARNVQLTNLKPGMYIIRVKVRATGETITERLSIQ
ncbi:MAG: T9SS type A sorting domain-containing protein [Lacibacter sp.]